MAACCSGVRYSAFSSLLNSKTSISTSAFTATGWRKARRTSSSRRSGDRSKKNEVRVSARIPFRREEELFDSKMKEVLQHRRGGSSSSVSEADHLSALGDVVNHVAANMEVYGSRLSRAAEAVSRIVRRQDGPDLASAYLDAQAIFLGMPLVPAVTELIMTEFLLLAGRDPKAPIILYINSTGTTRDDGEMVAMDSEGFAVYDVMTSVPNEVHTVLVGQAIGHACLLLAAGTKGQRYLNPHSLAMLEQPKMPSQGQMRADNLASNVEEAVHQRKKFIELIAKHTGQSLETVSKATESNFFMNPPTAIEFGVADKIMYRESPRKPIEFLSAEEWRSRFESPYMPPSMDMLF